MTTKNNRTARSRVSATVLALALGLALLAGLPLVDDATSAARAAPAQVDLNSAALEEILALPVPADIARRIYEHRVYERFYGSVYELMEVDGMTAALLEQLKPLVATIPPPVADASIARLSASFRTVQNFLGEEGASEGLADEYLDRLRNPQDVNELDLYDLMSYQNVSPVDAAAVIRARGQMGRIEDERQLRGVEGLRYFSFRGLRDYVVYNRKQVVPNELTGFMQTRFWEAQPLDTEDDLLNFALGRPRGRYTVDMVNPAQPGWMNKVRLNHNSGVQAGLVTAREYGEPDWNETTKAFVGLTDKRRGNLRLKSLMFGNYRVAWGLGLIMDNTDYLKYRKTGFGFDTRPIGVYGDLSRSFEFALTGAAAEGSWGPVQATAFISSADKDGVLNADGTINRYVVMRPRPDGDWLLDRSVGGVATGLRRNAFREDMLGGNVKVMLAPGTFLGVGGYEARYNRGFRADETTLVTDTSLLEARDAEIWNGYTSVYTDENGEVQTHKYRRVLGAEGQAVVANVSLQGEYAFLQDPRNSLFHKDNPDAYIINAFSQWDNLHLLAIWRDYDIGFDNPYSRAFSNDSRYEMTLLDAPYRLNDDLYTWLETATPQPKAEKGLFLDMRYRISRKLILNNLQFDQWTRKADGADLMRYTIKGEYQPVFNVRLGVRHRYSSRSEDDPGDVRKFRNWETRFQSAFMLSDYNRLRFTYMTANVMFPARPRLGGTDDAGAGDPAVGTAGSRASAFEARYEHNLSPGLAIECASAIYNGFFWNFEGNEFVVLDGNAFRNWISVESRVSDRLLCQLKVTRDHKMPRDVDIRYFGDPFGNAPDAQGVTRDITTVRLQMDYTF